MRPKKLQDALRKKYSMEVPYDRVVKGKWRALDTIYEKWGDGYDLLPAYQAELLRSLPESRVELQTEEHNGCISFMRSFVALKPCIDGFLQGCRPYIAMDATHLTGRLRGALASAAAVNGHNWLFPVAYGDQESLGSSHMMSNKRRTCPECGEVGHTAKHCQGGLTACQKKMIKYSQQNGQGEEHNDPNASASATRGRGRGEEGE
ncbi:hypothetical protein U9M48_012216, partial [Paspalum notatum var. saurae]